MSQTKAGAILCAARRIGVSIDEYKANQSAGLKWCTGCKAWRPVERFGNDRSRGDGKNTHCFGCTRVAVRVSTKGRPSTFNGRKHTDESKAKMSAQRKGRPGPWKGKNLPPDVRAKIAAVTRERTPRGEQHYAFSHGKHQRDKDGRRTVEYREWRSAVFARDDYACQECGDARGGNLQAHHRESYADNPSLRYVVDNGLTLCQDCHERRHLKPIPMPSDIRRRRKHV